MVKRFFLLFVAVFAFGCQKSEKRRIRTDIQISEKTKFSFAFKVIPYHFLSEVSGDLVRGCENAMVTLEESSQVLFQREDHAQEAKLLFEYGSLNRQQNHAAMTINTVLGALIQNAKILFDESEVYLQNPGPQDMDAESVCLHELGHALGLAHSGNSASVMFYKLYRGELKRRLTEEDERELLRRYSVTKKG